MRTGIKIKEKWKPHIVFALLVFALYGNTLNHSFVLDDAWVITFNRFTQQGMKGIPDILKYDTFSGYIHTFNDQFSLDTELLDDNRNYVAGGRYRPLSLITFALEIEFFGKDYTHIDNLQFRGNASFSHLTNIVMYLFTVCLFFLLLYRLFPPCKNKKWYLTFPFLATLLFLAHPIHTEVVANIKGRDEIMALFGSLCALLFTIKFMDTHRYHHLALAGLCMFLGLLSKENTITFLAVIPVTLYYFVTRSKKEIFVAMIPLMVVSALFLIIRTIVIGPIDSSEVLDLLNNPFVDATKSETYATVFYTLYLYIKLLVFPHPLTYDYYPHHIEIVNWLNPIAILSLLFYSGMGMYAIYGFVKKRDVFSWSIWLYLLPLSVVSNLFFPIGAFMGERFVFFSSIGFVVVVGWLIHTFFPKLISNEKKSMCLTIAVTVILLCLYSIKTIQRNKVWKDNFTLYTTDVKTSKNSAKGNYQAGLSFMYKAINPEDKNKIPIYCYEADRYFKKALLLYPQYIDAIIQLGVIHAINGDITQSLQYMTIVQQHETTINQRTDKITKDILNMTIIRLDNKRLISTPEEIIQACDLLLKIRPDIGEAFFLKAVVYGKLLNNIELSLLNFEQALVMDFPKNEIFYECLGAVYGIAGNYDNALQYLLKAVELGTDSMDTYSNLGVIYEELGDMDNARLYIQKSRDMSNR